MKIGQYLAKDTNKRSASYFCLSSQQGVASK